METEHVIYEDSPHYSFWQKGAVALVMVPIIIIFFYLFSHDVIIAIVAGLSIGAYHWVLFPRKYQILHDRLRIVLGGPKHDIPFDKIEIVRAPTRGEWFWGTTLGFGSYSAENVVQIVRKKRWFSPNINISPSDREKFLEHLSKAMDEWKTRKS